MVQLFGHGLSSGEATVKAHQHTPLTMLIGTSFKNYPPNPATITCATTATTRMAKSNQSISKFPPAKDSTEAARAVFQNLLFRNEVNSGGR